MQEEYLHYLWRMKRLNFSHLKLCNLHRQNIEVVETGWYNQDAGPDFFNGTVVIDGIQWSGNIEIHLKASDWYAHQHHLDPAYSNVVLHVVYQHDKDVRVNGHVLPTLELRNILDKKHLQEYQQLIRHPSLSNIPCYKEVMEHPLALLQQINISFLNRIERKGLALLAVTKDRDKNKILFTGLLKAIGGKTNALPMLELANTLPYEVLLKESWSKDRVEALLFGCAGFLKEKKEEEFFGILRKNWLFLKKKYDLEEMNVSTWKFSGIRPYSFPTYLLAQFTAFWLETYSTDFAHCTPEKLLRIIKNVCPKNISPYWKSHFTFQKKGKERNLYFSKAFTTNILINGIAPYFLAIKHLHNDFLFMDKVMELMELVPPENNYVVKYWKELGYTPKNALESQGLLELNNEFCNFKKCLSCKVGASILEKTNEKINSKNNVLL